jgi:putative membrane protein
LVINLKNNFMKNIIQLYIAVVIILLPSCNSGTDAVKDAKQENREKLDSQVAAQQRIDSLALAVLPSKEDADFLVNAASGGMLEVQLGQLAQTNAKDPRVKDFGAMMVKDHTAGGEKLKALAASRNITLPDSISNRQQKEKKQLQKMKGDAFDEAYINMMTDDHKNDIKEFEKEASGGTHPAIKTFAGEQLRILHVHLDSASSIQKMVAKKMPPVTTPPPPY